MKAVLAEQELKYSTFAEAALLHAVFFLTSRWPQWLQLPAGSVFYRQPAHLEEQPEMALAVHRCARAKSQIPRENVTQKRL